MPRSRKTARMRNRKEVNQGAKRKKQIRRDGTTPAFPIHPDKEKDEKPKRAKKQKEGKAAG